MPVKFCALIAALSLTLNAQTYGPREVKPEETKQGAGPARRYSADVRRLDLAMPHMATGGGWETVIVLVNMGTRSVTFDQDFYDPSGRDMPVTFRTIPEGEIITTAHARGTLAPGRSFNILLQDRGQALQTGWSVIDYDATNDRLGGFSIFRSIRAGGSSFEALVPLSSIDDYRFFMPFDNLEGFVTSMALLNVGLTPTQVSLTFRATNGDLLVNDTITLAAGNQTSFVIPDRYPQTRGRVGVLYVEGSTGFLSGLGFRFNNGGAFATIPIMNWSGMF